MTISSPRVPIQRRRRTCPTVSDRHGRGRTKSAASKGSRTRMEPLQPGVHHFGAPRVTAERQSSDDVQIPRERPTPRRLDFGEPEPKRPRTDRVRVG